MTAHDGVPGPTIEQLEAELTDDDSMKHEPADFRRTTATGAGGRSAAVGLFGSKPRKQHDVGRAPQTGRLASSPAKSRGSGAVAEVQSARPADRTEPVTGGEHDRGPARHREAANPEGTLRLHRRRRRRRDHPEPGTRILPRHRVQARCAAGRVRGGPGTQILGAPSALPFGIAPTGFTRMMQSEGEYAGSQAAEHAGIPYTLSTMGTASIEDVAKAAPNGRNWFQLYLWTDRDQSLDLIERAARAGYDTLMVTVDTAVAGARLRDVRNGMTIPPALTAKTVLDASYRPAWWFNFLTHEPLNFASLSNFAGTPSELINSMFDPTLTYDDLDWLRKVWKGKLVVKGIQTVDDAKKAVDHGADGIVISNHGGRQLDRAPIPLHLLPDVAAVLKGRTAIILDTGIMSGGDVIAAMALGADFTLVGRAYLYGLMAGGRAGVDRAIEILSTQASRTMQLLGVTQINDLGPEHVRLL